jgi:integrase
MMPSLPRDVTHSRPLDAVTWSAAVDAFIQRCEGNGLSPATIHAYRYALTGNRMPEFRELHGVNGPADLSADVMEALKLEFRAAGLSPSSVHHAFRTVRTFAKFCCDRGWVASRDILLVPGPRQPKRTPRTFTEEDEQRLLESCRHERDRVLVRFVIETGLRRSEIANLTVDDVVERNHGWLIHVRQGKGAKDRTVPVSEVFSRELAQYLAHVRPRSACPALFLTLEPRRDGDHHRPLGPVGIYMVWRRLGKSIGITAYPHRARHTFATRLAQDGVDPWAIQRSLGHSSIRMTQGYVNLAAVDLKEAFSRRKVHASPAPHPPPPPVALRMDHAAWAQLFPSAEGALPWYVEREVTGDEGTVLVRCFVSLTAVLADELELQVGTLPQLLRAAIDDYGRPDGPVGIRPSMQSIYAAVRAALG